jgi:hypothetical protein
MLAVLPLKASILSARHIHADIESLKAHNTLK